MIKYIIKKTTVRKKNKEMIIQNNQLSEQENNEGLLTMKDLVLGERIKKVTTHEYVFINEKFV